MPIQTDDKIRDLILSREERKDLDYKEIVNLAGERSAKAEIAKDVIAMANSNRG